MNRWSATNGSNDITTFHFWCKLQLQACHKIACFRGDICLNNSKKMKQVKETVRDLQTFKFDLIPESFIHLALVLSLKFHRILSEMRYFPYESDESSRSCLSFTPLLAIKPKLFPF